MKAFSIIAIVVASFGILGSLALDNPDEVFWGLVAYGFFMAVSICFYNSVKGTK